MHFKQMNYTKEQIAEFQRRSCDFKLGYEDCALLGLALCAEREQILAYLMKRDADCRCEKCEAARDRLRAIAAAIDTIKAGVMAVWPELHAEAERRRASDETLPDEARRMAADLLSKITGRTVAPEDVQAVHVIDPGDDDEDDEIDPVDFARFSPEVGHG